MIEPSNSQTEVVSDLALGDLSRRPLSSMFIISLSVISLVIRPLRPIFLSFPRCFYCRSFSVGLAKCQKASGPPVSYVSQRETTRPNWPFRLSTQFRGNTSLFLCFCRFLFSFRAFLFSFASFFVFFCFFAKHGI